MRGLAKVFKQDGPGRGQHRSRIHMHYDGVTVGVGRLWNRVSYRIPDGPDQTTAKTDLQKLRIMRSQSTGLQ